MKRILFFLLFISAIAKAQVGNQYLTNTYNPVFYGAKADSATDCQPALQRIVNAIAASPSKKGRVFFPSGVFSIQSTVVVPQGVHINWQGSGSTHDSIISPTTVSQGYGITKLVMGSTTLDMFRDSSVGATYSDMDLQNVASSNATAGAGINAIGTLFKATNITVSRFFYGIEQQNTTDPEIDHCGFRDCVQYSYYSFNLWNSDIGDDIISNCFFRSFYTRTVAHIFKLGSGGAKISNCKFNAGGTFFTDGIKVTGVNSGYSTTDLSISGCSIENFVGSGINVAMSGGATFKNVSITGGNISSYQSGNGITLTNSASTLSRIAITGVVINNCTVGITTTGVVDDLNISGCSNAATTPLSIASATNVFYDRNTATTTQDGLAAKELVTAFLSTGGVPTLGVPQVVEEFNRANTANIVGSTPAPTGLGTWAQGFSSGFVNLGITSNQLTCASNGSSIIHTATGIQNQDVSVVILAPTLTAGQSYKILGSYTDVSNFLMIDIQPGNGIGLYKQIAGAFTALFTGTRVIAVGDTIHLRTSGGVAYCIVNSTVLGSGAYSLVSLPNTDAGLYWVNNTATSTIMDHFVVSNVSAGVSGWQVTHDASLTGLGTAGTALTVTNPPITGHATLASGTVTITATGATSASTITANVIGPSGGSSTVMLQGTCTTNSCTIQANIAAGTINASDNSTVQYTIFIH